MLVKGGRTVPVRAFISWHPRAMLQRWQISQSMALLKETLSVRKEENAGFLPLHGCLLLKVSRGSPGLRI